MTKDNKIFEKTRLVFHHHTNVYMDDVGGLWLHSGIARWINALAPYFSRVDLLLHQTAKRRPKQDTLIVGKNIHLVSLGDPGYLGNWFSRRARIVSVCKEAGKKADALLIRGITPRQWLVWRKVEVPQKAFLLVRSPQQERIIDLSIWSWIGFVLNKIREFQFTQIARSETVVLVNSKTVLPEIERKFNKQAYFVPTNIIKKDEIPELSFSKIHSPIRLLYVGRMQYLKGLRELLAGVAKLKASDIPIHLDIVAGLEEPVHADLLNLAANLGIDSDIGWHGFVPFGEPLFAHYRTADIFVLPSYTEGFPRVFWEAAANCCPVITTNVGGVSAMLKDETHVLLIPPKDVNAIVVAVRRLVADDTLRNRIVANAHRLVLDYTVESCAEKLATVLGSEWTHPDA